MAQLDNVWRQHSETKIIHEVLHHTCVVDGPVRLCNMDDA